MAATKKVLVIEDEKPMARALVLKLTHKGFEALSAGDGEAGMQILTKEKPDLVLLDLVMPKIDGFTFLAKMKEAGNKTPVMILSNLSQEEDEKRARQMGAKDFFVKSNTPISTIVDKVAELLT